MTMLGLVVLLVLYVALALVLVRARVRRAVPVSFGLTVAAWLGWLMLAWSVPAVAQYTPPPGCGTPCKVTILKIKSGTTLTIQDTAANTLGTMTDAGTSGSWLVGGALSEVESAGLTRIGSTVNNVNFFSAADIKFSANGGDFDWFDSAANTLAFLDDAGTTGIFGIDSIRPSTAGGNNLFEDSAGNDTASVFDEGTTGSIGSTSGRFRSYTESNTYLAVEESEDVVEVLVNGSQEFQVQPTGIVVTDKTTTSTLAVGGGAALTGIMPFSGTFAFGATALDECLENTITATGVVNGRPCAMSNFGETGQEAGLRLTCETNTDSISVIVCCSEVAGCSSVGSDTYYVVTFKW